MRVSTVNRSVFLLCCYSVSLARWSLAVSPTTQFAVSIGHAADQCWKNLRQQGRSRKNRSIPCDSNQAALLPPPTTTTRANPRGGAAAVAHLRTMSARQMETFNLLSGGVAGSIASCMTSPLEVIKTNLQASVTENGKAVARRANPVAIAQRILVTDGIPGFFRGLVPTLIGIIPARSAYFYSYQQSKKAMGPVFAEGSPPNALLAGLIAGITSNTISNPIFMVRTRVQLLADVSTGQRNYAGYGDAIGSIWREEGLGGFYKGIMASYWGCAEGAAQFLIYEQLKTRLLVRQNAKRAAQGLAPSDDLPKATYFWSAALAKCVASIATYPHEVARTRMREQAREGIFRYKGMWQTLALVSREEGKAAMYSGMGVHLIEVVPNSALMFLTYEMVRSWLATFTIVDQQGNVVRTGRRK